MRVANHKKLLPVVGLAVPLLLACAWLVAAERGPFECNNGCQIDYPKPDPLTADYVEQMKPWFFRVFGDVFWNKGDTYIICNATHCAKYYITDDFGLYGKEGRIEREGGGSGDIGIGGGGSETGGDGGGYNPGAGGGGGGSFGSGKVIVGDPVVVQN